MGVQPVGQSDLRQLPYAGRPGVADGARVPGAPRSLPQRVPGRHQQPALGAVATLQRGDKLRPGGSKRSEDLLRQRLGPQVLAAGGDSLPLLDRGPAQSV